VASRRATVLTIVGARPQFIKLAPVSRALRRRVREVLVHTGQHYDDAMSARFFRELGLPRVDRHLWIGSATHGRMTGRMLEALERVLLEVRPALTLVFGDTNSTLAGALAATKLGVPVAHVEAGLRSFDPRMPEEVNRRLTDHVSRLLFCPTTDAVRNLKAEGISRGVHRVGDVMMDAVKDHAGRLARYDVRRFGVEPARYYVATLHRQENTDEPTRLKSIVGALDGLGFPVLLPLHPRTAARFRALGLRPQGAIKVLPPLGHVEMLALVRRSRALLTDSGGLQKESFIVGTPCVTLRDTTEWKETLRGGANRLAGADPALIRRAIGSIEKKPPRWTAARVYGDGKAAERIARLVEGFVSRRSSGR
jgi:UDP-GlcNAc3NAcA epimerase